MNFTQILGITLIIQAGCRPKDDSWRRADARPPESRWGHGALPQAISGLEALNRSKRMRLNNLPEIQFDKYPAIFL
jgi:hypothetical protein